jgi:transcriptional regulator with XRE-family HTH domain
VAFPVIDPIATGKNILSLRKEKGLTVRNLQEYFGFEEPQAIYRWQYGKTLPSVDNLFALSAILGVPMEKILVRSLFEAMIDIKKQQETQRR